MPTPTFKKFKPKKSQKRPMGHIARKEMNSV